MQQQAQRVEVQFGPPDDAQPVPTEAPKRSWKQQRHHNKLMKQASAEMIEQTKSLKMVKDALNLKYEGGKVNGLDPRAVNCYCEGFHLNKYGKPLTDADAQAFEEDKKLTTNYLSRDKTAHDKALQDILNKFLAIKVSPLCFEDPENTVKNFADYSQMSFRVVYFENIMKENPEYFSKDNLGEALVEQIKAKVNCFSDGKFNQTLSAIARMNGLSPNSGEYDGRRDKSSRALYQEYKNDFKNALIKTQMDPVLAEESKNVRARFEAMNNSGPALNQNLKNDQRPTAVHNAIYQAERAMSTVKEAEPHYAEIKALYDKYKQDLAAYDEQLIQQTTFRNTISYYKGQMKGDDQDRQTQAFIDVAEKNLARINKDVNAAQNAMSRSAQTVYTTTRTRT